MTPAERLAQIRELIDSHASAECQCRQITHEQLVWLLQRVEKLEQALKIIMNHHQGYYCGGCKEALAVLEKTTE